MKSDISTPLTGLSPSKASHSRELLFVDLATDLHHISCSLSKVDSVCPIPFSLAAIRGITFCFLFLPVLRCFNSRRRFSSQNSLARKLSNSEISGSKTACVSPELIAACHVLLQSSNQAIHLLVSLVYRNIISVTIIFSYYGRSNFTDIN